MALRYDEPTDGPDVATDPIGSPAENFQVIKVAFGSQTDATRVERSVPLPARDYHGGTDPFDSGLVVVAAGAPVLHGPGVDTWLDAVLLVNVTLVVQKFQITDGDGLIYGGRALDPGECRPVPMFGFKLSNGVKVGATNAAAVFVQFKGTR